MGIKIYLIQHLFYLYFLKSVGSSLNKQPGCSVAQKFSVANGGTKLVLCQCLMKQSWPTGDSQAECNFGMLWAAEIPVPVVKGNGCSQQAVSCGTLGCREEKAGEPWRQPLWGNVLSLAGIELIFFTPLGMGMCFAFVLNPGLKI